MGDKAAGRGERMTDQTVDFSLIGHQESSRATADVFALLRGPEYPPVSDEEIMSIVPWIPPRAVCRVETHSRLGAKSDGLYIDSFIPPDRLDTSFTQENPARVPSAAAYAIKAGATIVSLGGFSSILIPTNFLIILRRRTTPLSSTKTTPVLF